MGTLTELMPTEKPRVIDLVRSAGVDVSDWARFEWGEDRAASNPKYCYEWSFFEPKTVVVLNLWHAPMQERTGTIFTELNFRESTEKYALNPRNPTWERRSRNVDLAIQVAVRDSLPIRVVVCDGKMRDVENNDSGPSKVKKRCLDPLPWAVTAYDSDSGACTVTRGAVVDRFVDQFEIHTQLTIEPERRTVSGEVFVRSAAVRKCVLSRANRDCEWCGHPGFTMIDGRVYLETHHVIPLSEGGSDTDDNVVALCPNYHREAHFGTGAADMREQLLAVATQKARC